MSRNIEQELKEMLVERLFLKYKPNEIEDDKNLMETYGIDSVMVMEMVVGLEELYGITFGKGEFKLETFQTVRNMADFVRSKTNA
jgi:acyl carrier protein